MNQLLLTDEVLTELKVFMLQMKSRLQGDIMRYGDDDSPVTVGWVNGCNKQLTFAKFIYDAAQAATPVPEEDRMTTGHIEYRDRSDMTEDELDEAGDDVSFGEMHKCSECGEVWESVEEAESCAHYACSDKQGGAK